MRNNSPFTWKRRVQAAKPFQCAHGRLQGISAYRRGADFISKILRQFPLGRKTRDSFCDAG